MSSPGELRFFRPPPALTNAEGDVVPFPSSSPFACGAVSVCDVSSTTVRDTFFRRKQSSRNRNADVPDRLGEAACPNRDATSETSVIGGEGVPGVVRFSDGCVGWVVEEEGGRQVKFEMRFKAGAVEIDDSQPRELGEFSGGKNNFVEIGLPVKDKELGGGRIYALSYSACGCNGTRGDRNYPVKVAGVSTGKAGSFNLQYDVEMVNANGTGQLGWEEALFPTGCLVVVIVEVVGALVFAFAAVVKSGDRVGLAGLKRPVVAIVISLVLKSVSNGFSLAYFRALANDGSDKSLVAIGRLPFLFFADVTTAMTVMGISFGDQFIPSSWRRASGRTGLVPICSVRTRTIVWPVSELMSLAASLLYLFYFALVLTSFAYLSLHFSGILH